MKVKTRKLTMPVESMFSFCILRKVLKTERLPRAFMNTTDESYQLLRVLNVIGPDYEKLDVCTVKSLTTC